MVGSCAESLGDLDRRVERATQSRSEALGSGVSPQRTWPEAPAHSGRENRTSPTTMDPPASQLAFEPADPARPVEQRLEAMARSAAGVGAVSSEPNRPASGASIEPQRLGLADALRIAQQTGREHLNAEESYILAAIDLLIEQHRWSPRLFNDTSLTLAGEGDEGSFRSAASVINELRIARRLPFGGEVEAGWLWRATEQLREQASGRYTQSSQLRASARIPLLRGGGETARESLTQSERSLVYASRDFEDFRRRFFFEIASDYLELLQSKAQISNQKRALRSLREALAGDQLRFEAGRISQFQQSITQNRVLEEVAALASARERYIVQADRLKIRLGIPVEAPVVFLPTIFDLAEPEVTPQASARRALEYRLDWQNQQDRLDDARRRIDVADNALEPTLDVTGDVTLPTDPNEDVGGLGFDVDETEYSVGLQLSLPLDRRIERLQSRQARIRHEQERRRADQLRDTIVLDARASVRSIELARFQLTLAEKQVEIAELRLEEQKLRADRVTSQERVDTEDTRLRALNARDRAATDLRIAVLRYLLRTGQLRVARDGQLEALPGMDVVDVRVFEELDDFESWYDDDPQG